MRRTLIYGTALAVSLGAIVMAAAEDHSDSYYEPSGVGSLAGVTDETVATCEIDLDDHPTRDEVVELLGEPIDVDHTEGEDNLDGSEWLPATDTLMWADGDIVTFDSDNDRASSWAIDDPRVC